MCSPAKSDIPRPFIDVDVPLDAQIPNRLSAAAANDDGAVDCSIAAILYKIRPNWDMEKCQIEVFTNGTTNKIFCVSHGDDGGDGDKLVFRVFGIGTEQLVDRQTELATFDQLARAGLVPPIHATFKNGLVCGFLPGHCPSIESVRQPDVVDKICRTMAAMHKIPLSNTANGKSVLLDKSAQWLNSMPSKFASKENQEEFDGYFAGIDLQQQFRQLQAALDRINSPIVFSHNDVSTYNILIDDAAGKVHFIDYEYAGPNYQLFDIANHLCEYPGNVNPDFERDGPTDSERKHFLTRYFFHFRGEEPNGGELDKLLGETMHFEAASHFFWAIWSIHQANLSQIPFDFMQYARIRHRQFHRFLAQMNI